MTFDRQVRVAVCSRSFSKHPILRAELLERYPNVTFNDSGASLSGDELVEFLAGHERAITALERLDAGLLARLPDLKVIAKYGVGLDMLDLAAMRRLGIRLGWTGGVNKRSVSELALAMAIASLRRIPAASRSVLSREWRPFTGLQLSGRTVGIVGCGHVGKDFVRLLAPFNCRILVHDLLSFPDFYEDSRVEATSFGYLLENADVVSIHVPLDSNTLGMFSRAAISKCKPGAVLVNTARGGIVDEEALMEALESGHIGAAAFDVFAQEPPTNFSLLDHPNFLATPHIGGSSAEAVLAMGRSAIHGLELNELP